MSFLKGGAEIPDPEKNPLPTEEEAVLNKLANKVVEKRMSVPAILFLESVKPLNFIGSQTMIFFEPIVQTVFNFKDYDTLRIALEKRDTIEILLLKIEALDAVTYGRERRIKKFMKQEKKKWKWYQRWLGIMIPKYTIPKEVLNPPEEKSENQNKSN